ncbi:M23 family metallopeptidase [Indioceanicola profundi]|uniref:M23 family metallopeptidase n=1 Tax=Indioceanicola profundi TaxID=2220096 RepID=UPI000E6AC81D|nr:M23 family metallopeptidase [Indioceanicola profundi]
MLNRAAVTTVTAAALGALVAAAIMVPRPAPELAMPALTPPTVAAVDEPSPPLPVILPDFDREQGLSLAGDAWGDAEIAVEPVERRVVSLGRGGTLIQLLLDAEVPREQAHEAVAAMRKVHNPRQLRLGQEFSVLFDRTGEEPRFVGFEFQPAVEKVVSVTAGDEGFRAAEIEKPLARLTVGARGTINSSLYQAGAEAGVPMPILAALIRTYSYDVDFQRDVHEGDGFEVLFDRYTTEDGSIAREGAIRYAALKLGNKVLPVYRYEFQDGTVDYFTRKGESIRKALLRTPIDGARISSKFGMRRHPVLGYSKMHKGMDFAAPTGTPIYAAGDGVIEEAGQKGSYGNYVRIRHNGKIQTAYAHLSRFGANIRRGARVTQGDVIGFVGTTGRSTGPHLHYEVLENGRQTNPLKADMPTGRTLDGKEMARFKALVAEVDEEFARATAVAAAQPAGTLELVSASGEETVKSGACSREPGC